VLHLWPAIPMGPRPTRRRWQVVHVTASYGLLRALVAPPTCTSPAGLPSAARPGWCSRLTPAQGPAPRRPGSHSSGGLTEPAFSTPAPRIPARGGHPFLPAGRGTARCARRFPDRGPRAALTDERVPMCGCQPGRDAIRFICVSADQWTREQKVVAWTAPVETGAARRREDGRGSGEQVNEGRDWGKRANLGRGRNPFKWVSPPKLRPESVCVDLNLCAPSSRLASPRRCHHGRIQTCRASCRDRRRVRRALPGAIGPDHG
jgi:hypothetical protein